MYKKGEAASIRQSFWTAFGKYMTPISSANGEPINWMNYKTGIKNIYFRMDADKTIATIAIEICQPDLEIQQLFFQKFIEFKNIIHECLNEEWNWQLHVADENGKVISRISMELASVNIFNENDWQKIITFLKPRIIALDKFWSEFKEGFDGL